MSKANNMMISEALESMQSGLIDFLKPKLSLPEPDWKEVVEPAINPAFLPIYKKKIKDGAKSSLEILDLASFIKIITWNWRKYYDDIGYDAKNYFFEVLNIRNKIAHQEAGDIPNEDALRALDRDRARQ
ncbi:hypothetical protein ES703_82131 [subsurface metagenome]